MKGNPPTAAFTFGNEEYAARNVDVPEPEPSCLPQAQARAVQDDQQQAQRPTRHRLTPLAGNCGQRKKLPYLRSREDVGKELRLRRLRRPFSTGNESAGIVALPITTELSDDAELDGDRDRLAAFFGSEPGEHGSAKAPLRSSASVPMHESIELSQGELGSPVREPKSALEH
jgi:hypothetical protein